MCKRNSPDKVRERENKQKRCQHGICKRNSPDKKRSQHRMCKRNTSDKNEPSTGCITETPPIKN